MACKTARICRIANKASFATCMATLAVCSAALAQDGAVPSPIGTRADLGDFLIDVTEITVGQFKRYAEKQALRTAAEREGGGHEWGSGWERRAGWTYRTPFGKPAADEEPAVHLNWSEAQAYCAAAGGRLPSKAQWQQAAYIEQRKTPPAHFQHGRTYPYPTGDTPAGANVLGDADGWQRHAPAGRTRPGVNGLYDAGGNVWEWLADAQGNERLTAGGSWWYGADKMKAESMQYKPAAFYAVYVGFRCVYAKR